MRVLGIETSCDETAAAVVEDGRRVLSDVVSTQIEIHRRWGGVVPELASRNHVVQVMPVVDEALRGAGVEGPALDGIAVTSGPGLVGALLVGVQVAKALSLAWDVPLARVNHLEGHLLATFLSEEAPAFPYLGWWSRAATPPSTWPRTSAATGSSGRPATTPPARPSTRGPSCSGCPIRAAWPSTGWPGAAMHAR